MDVIKADVALKARNVLPNGPVAGDEEDDDYDDWNPVEQEAASSDNRGDGENSDDNDDSDDDWMPSTQGAADVNQSEKEALENPLRPRPIVEHGPSRFETNIGRG